MGSGLRVYLKGSFKGSFLRSFCAGAGCGVKYTGLNLNRVLGTLIVYLDHGTLRNSIEKHGASPLKGLGTRGFRCGCFSLMVWGLGSARCHKCRALILNPKP